MQESIERNRHGCNLNGALQTITQINGVVPILHSTPGCGIQSYLSNKAGGSSTGYVNGYSVPNTNVYEKQIIFGGTSRLREQIKNTVKVIEGDLYVTISGCGAEMVGDDLIAMTQESIDQGEKAIYYKAPGFKGNEHVGYEGVVSAIISQLSCVTQVHTEKVKGLINIFGVLPKQDIYWQGNLNEIERILENIGIKTNKLFGYGQGIEQWKDIASAELNVVVSKWGRSAAEKAKEKYGTPFIQFDDIGLGADDVGHFVSEIAKKMGIETDKVEAYLENEKNKFTYALEQITEYYFEYDFQKSVAIVGDESTVIRYSKFLAKYLGLEVEVAIITDSVGEENRTEATASIKEFANEVYFSKDSSGIDKIITNGNVELILGSGLENRIAKKLDISNYIVSYPAFGKVVIGKSDVGYTGAVTLLEDLSNLFISKESNVPRNKVI